VVGSPQVLAALAPLLEARRRHGPVCHAESVAALIDVAGSVLIIGGEPPTCTHLINRSGHPVPSGWLPSNDLTGLHQFGRTAAEVVHRSVTGHPAGPFVLLSARESRAIALADEIALQMPSPSFRWTAERLARHELLPALGWGHGMALYVGHGTSSGWLGYGGIDAKALAQTVSQPLGALLSVTCDTARLSAGTRDSNFCTHATLCGLCAAALGATGKTLHANNRLLSVALAKQAGRANTLADLLSAVPAELLAGYVVIGDPAASLVGTAQASMQAPQVRAPAPTAVLDLAAGWV
jgi:hypothetical protein